MAEFLSAIGFGLLADEFWNGEQIGYVFDEVYERKTGRPSSARFEYPDITGRQVTSESESRRRFPRMWAWREAMSR